MKQTAPPQEPTSTQPRARAWLGQVSDSDLRLLRVFLLVADCGGMTAAELELNISTSTISRHVKDLETRLGLTLCRRGRGGFALTPEGVRLVNEARQLLTATEQFRASVNELHQRLGGAVHLAVFDKTASNPQAHIAQAVALFRRQAPDVVLNLHVVPLQAIERGVLDGTYHVGIIPEHRRSQSLRYDVLFHETMLLYCGQGHPLFAQSPSSCGWEAVRPHPLAGLGYHSPNMEVCHRQGLQRQATAFDQESVATLVLSGDFVGFLPDHYAQGFVQADRLRPIHPQLLRYDCQFAAITPASGLTSRAGQWLHQCLLQSHLG